MKNVNVIKRLYFIVPWLSKTTQFYLPRNHVHVQSSTSGVDRDREKSPNNPPYPTLYSTISHIYHCFPIKEFLPKKSKILQVIPSQKDKSSEKRGSPLLAAAQRCHLKVGVFSVKLFEKWWEMTQNSDVFFLEHLNWQRPMANLTKLLGITYFIGKIEFKLLFHGPKRLSKWKCGGWFSSSVHLLFPRVHVQVAMFVFWGGCYRIILIMEQPGTSNIHFISGWLSIGWWTNYFT